MFLWISFAGEGDGSCLHSAADIKWVFGLFLFWQQTFTLKKPLPLSLCYKIDPDHKMLMYCCS